MSNINFRTDEIDGHLNIELFIETIHFLNLECVVLIMKTYFGYLSKSWVYEKKVKIYLVYIGESKWYDHQPNNMLVLYVLSKQSLANQVNGPSVNMLALVLRRNFERSCRVTISLKASSKNWCQDVNNRSVNCFKLHDRYSLK